GMLLEERRAVARDPFEGVDPAVVDADDAACGRPDDVAGLEVGLKKPLEPFVAEAPDGVPGCAGPDSVVAAPELGAERTGEEHENLCRHRQCLRFSRVRAGSDSDSCFRMSPNDAAGAAFKACVRGPPVARPAGDAAICRWNCARVVLPL